MPYKFSQKLREKLKVYLLERHGVEISEEQADEYLDSMADLYLVLRVPNAAGSLGREADEETAGVLFLT